jgi:hypothetical protein
MCCCGKPVINGEFGYIWNGGQPGIHPVNPPPTDDRETLLYDEPGRCGGLDSHCHHYRVVLTLGGGLYLLVRHGGGDERVYLSSAKTLTNILAALDSTGRYWILNAIFHAQSSARSEAQNNEASRWRKAAANKQIKTRKQRDGSIKVWIETAGHDLAGRR